MPQFSGTLYPDRQFSIGVVGKKKKRSADSIYDRDIRNQPDVDYGCLSDWLTGSTSILGKWQSTSESGLFIESPKSSRAKRGKYGKHGITRFGRKFVRNASILLERKYGKERLGFVTCTLPSFPRQLHERINGVWGEVVRRFYQKLKRQLAKISKHLVYTGVTEIQEKRFERTGVPAPHLHFVYLCRDSKSSGYWLYVCQIHRAWNQALREGIQICGYPMSMSSLPGWGSVHCKRVQKSAAAYLGKYLTKGCGIVESMKEAGWEEFPRQWWSASQDVKKLYQDSLIRLDSHTCESFFYELEAWLHEGVIEWCRFVVVTIDEVDRTMGLVGTLSKSAYACMQC